MFQIIYFVFQLERVLNMLKLCGFVESAQRGVVQKIEEVARHLSDENNQCIWSFSLNGIFSLKSTLDICKEKLALQGVSRGMWSHLIPNKWSIILWRVMRVCVAFNDVLQHKGYQLTYKS